MSRETAKSVELTSGTRLLIESIRKSQNRVGEINKTLPHRDIDILLSILDEIAPNPDNMAEKEAK